MVVKPSASRGKITLNSSRQSLQIATGGGIELVAVIATGGSGGTVVRIYDNPDGANAASPSLDSFIVAANGGESTCFTPNQPILMDNGLYAEIEQPSGNAEATIFYNKS